MKKWICIIILSFNINAGDWVWGEVVLDHYECTTNDRIVIETRRGYVLAEVYSGYSYTHEGAQVIGDFHSYGFTRFNTNTSTEQTVGRLYIEDYMVSESDAVEWCSE
jgi:hypothetical protein